MKKVFVLVFLIITSGVFAQVATFKNGRDLISAMHTRYKLGPCKTYRFSQKNTHYKNDTVSGHSVWHEYIQFPDKFRIDFGSKEEGNYIIFKNDSAFNYKKGQFLKSRADSNTLLLLLGGMFYRELPEVLKRIEQATFDLQVLSQQSWQNRKVYVIGAKENEANKNQIWIDQTTLRVLRIIEKLNDKDWMDLRFEAHQAWCKGYVETKVSFRRNGKLEQVEEYYDIKEISSFPD